MLLAGRKGFLFAVDRPARRREDDFFDTGLTRPFEYIKQPEQVDPRVKEWVGHRAADIHLGGVVIQYLDLLLDDQPPDGGVLNIRLNKARAGITVLLFSG